MKEHSFPEEIMHLTRSLSRLSLAAVLIATPLFAAAAARGRNEDGGAKVKHVLLISVDGLHALDVANYVAAHPQSTMAQLSAHGATYTNASTSEPSDSFPGLAALLTGGSPTTTGFWYDVTFNR